MAGDLACSPKCRVLGRSPGKDQRVWRRTAGPLNKGARMITTYFLLSENNYRRKTVDIKWLNTCIVIGCVLFDNRSVQVSSPQHYMATPPKSLAIPGLFNTPVLRQCLMRISSSPLNCGAKIFRTGNYFAANWIAIGDLEAAKIGTPHRPRNGMHGSGFFLSSSLLNPTGWLNPAGGRTDTLL